MAQKYQLLSSIKRKRQKGAVLIVSMLLLIIMTLLGLSSMRNTTLEEKMAGNSRDIQLAFNAAEAALRQAETYLQVASLPPFVNISFDTDGNHTGGVGGYYQADTTIWKNIDWSDVDDGSGTGMVLSVSATPLQGVAAQPAVYIEEMPAILTGGSLEAGTPLTTGMYRITARGVGGSNTAVAILQATFRR